eukprot:COSAG01_NODE_1668_length_9563_cov_23.675613_8_plen_211_part_00
MRCVRDLVRSPGPRSQTAHQQGPAHTATTSSSAQPQAGSDTHSGRGPAGPRHGLRHARDGGQGELGAGLLRVRLREVPQALQPVPAQAPLPQLWPRLLLGVLWAEVRPPRAGEEGGLREGHEEGARVRGMLRHALGHRRHGCQRHGRRRPVPDAPGAPLLPPTLPPCCCCCYLPRPADGSRRLLTPPFSAPPPPPSHGTVVALGRSNSCD